MNHNTQTTRPATASEILRHAEHTLGERGKQYDPAAGQERSMTAIVAAFNAIYASIGVQLTVHMGWQFMALVKMVRGAAKPHADSALDQVAFGALAAEEVAQQLHSQEQLREAYAHNPYVGKAAVERKQNAEVAALMKQIRAGYKGCPQCGADVDKEAGSCQCGWEFEEEEPAPTAAKRVEQLLGANQVLAEELGKCQHWAGVQSQELKHLEAKAMAAHEAYTQAFEHNRSLEVQLDATHSALSDFVCRFDLTKEYMTKEQVLAGQAKHEAQVSALTAKLAAQQELLTVAQHNANFYFDKTNGCIAANESMTAKFQAERKANVAMHEEATRLRGKVQELADLAEYRDQRNAKLCAQLESARNSLRISEQAAEEKIQLLSNELTAKTRELVQMHTQREAPVAHNTDEAVDGKCNNLLPRGGLVQPTSNGSLCDASVASVASQLS